MKDTFFRPLGAAWGAAEGALSPVLVLAGGRGGLGHWGTQRSWCDFSEALRCNPPPPPP